MNKKLYLKETINSTKDLIKNFNNIISEYVNENPKNYSDFLDLKEDNILVFHLQNILYFLFENHNLDLLIS